MNSIKTIMENLKVMSYEEEQAMINQEIIARNETLTKSFEEAIPTRYKKASLENYYASCDESKKALEACKRQLDERANVILHGDYGTGKTHLAIGMLRKAHMAKKRVKYYTVSTLLRELRQGESWKSEKVLNTIAKYDLIVIDEIGRTKGTDSEQSQLFEVLDMRYAEMKPTILISNLDKKGLLEHLGTGLISRLVEGSNYRFECNWGNYRLKTNKEPLKRQ